MAHNDGALARQLDFGGEGTGTGQRAGARRLNRGLRLAVPSAVLRGPDDKYKVLEHRRRQAQIKARRIIDAGDRLDFEG